MPVVVNKGGALTFPGVVIRGSGSTMVEPSSWSKIKQTAAVKSHLESGRLAVVGPDNSPKAKPEPEGELVTVGHHEPAVEVSLPEAIDENQDGIPELSALSAKSAADLVGELTLEELEVALEGEERKTVLAAAEKRREELEASEG